ncbi:MAG: hypothetical protein SYR96_10140, partial [Actinomycetota bacterium]|nr:hypothetical protein [Actinomycetota bacterium]
RRRLEEAVAELHPAALEKLGDMSDTTLRTAGRTVRARRRPSQHTRPRGPSRHARVRGRGDMPELVGRGDMPGSAGRG